MMSDGTRMPRSTTIVISVVLTIAFILALIEIPLLIRQKESIRFLEETPSVNYPIWDVPEDEPPQTEKLRKQRYREESVKDGILCLICFVMFPLDVGFVLVACIASLKSLTGIPKGNKKTLPIIFLTLSVLLFATHLSVFIQQTRI